MVINYFGIFHHVIHLKKYKISLFPFTYQQDSMANSSPVNHTYTGDFKKILDEHRFFSCRWSTGKPNETI